MKLRRIKTWGRTYTREAQELLEAFGPQIYTCRKCTHPVLAWYCCTFCGDTDPSIPPEDEHTEQNLDYVVSRAQERAEREYNRGEQQTCGGCRHYSYGYCRYVDSIALPMGVSMETPAYAPDTIATDCEAWEAN